VANLRYCLRPGRFLTTPKRLAEGTGCEKIFRYPARRGRELPLFNTDKDLILAWPNVGMFEDACELTAKAVEFYNMNKKEQRAYICDKFGWYTPENWVHVAEKCVVRPKRHFGGQDFTVIPKSNAGLIDESTHYASPLFERTHEYRVILVRGAPVCILTKKAPDDRTPSQEEPWNHANGFRFVTCNPGESLLERNTSMLCEQTNPLIGFFHIIGVDVLYNKYTHRWAVTEINFAPGITVENNLDKICSYLTTEDPLSSPIPSLYNSSGYPSMTTSETYPEDEDEEEYDEEEYDIDEFVYDFEEDPFDGPELNPNWNNEDDTYTEENL